MKAGRESQKARKDFPDAKFTVILTTNQHLPKGVELLKKVYKKAAELGVDVDIWEQLIWVMPSPRNSLYLLTTFL